MQRKLAPTIAVLLSGLLGCTHKRALPSPVPTAEVIRVTPQYRPIADAEVEMVRLMNAEVRNADVRKGWVDYAARMRMRHLMRQIEAGWAVEGQK